MLRVAAALIAFLFAVAGLASAAPDTSVDPLIGVWEAKLRFGPDVEWVDELDYEVDPRRGETFYEAVRSFWPELPDNSLLPA